MKENTEEAIKNGQSRETGSIGNTRREKTKQKQHNMRFYAEIVTDITTRNSERRTMQK
jgi:hypothetical protein